MKPNMTATRPALMPAISLPPFALPFVVLEADAALPVAVPVAVPVTEAPVVVACKTWPKLGRATLPFTNQPPAVELGQAGGVTDGV